jgi:hypothetical protein
MRATCVFLGLLRSSILKLYPSLFGSRVLLPPGFVGLVPVWLTANRIDWRELALVTPWEVSPEEGRLGVPPRADPWEPNLPWAVHIIPQTGAVVGDRDRGCACARAADTPTRRSVGTSVTARTRSASGWFDAGKRRGGRPVAVRTRPSKPSTPRRSGCAVVGARFRRNRQRLPKLRRRVVTQQEFFGHFTCASDRAVMNRLPSSAATRPSIAAALAAGPFTAFAIVNANG